MSDAEDKDPFNMSVKGIRGWLVDEVSEITKASELRVAEATAFVEAYASGQLSQDELTTRISKYSERWGEALPGVSRHKTLTDDQILSSIDRTRAWQNSIRPDTSGKGNPSREQVR